jgi:uncharacterized protein
VNPEATVQSGQSAGLCAVCRHARRIRSDRGSVFILCGLSSADPRFPKYPRLPVLSCDGFRQIAVPRAEPVQDAERIQAIDVLRGVALLGILLVNIQSFSMPDAAIFNPTAYGDLTGVNRWVWLVTHIFFEQKFMTIFSMLFGAGLVLMTGRLEDHGVRPGPVHYRRLTALLAFGLLHAYLVWTGDILVWYAMCGSIVYLFRKKGARSLIKWGMGTVAVASILSLAFGWSMPYWGAESVEDLARNFAPSNEDVAEDLAAYRGGWFSQVAHRAPAALQSQIFSFLVWGLWRAGGLMLVGMGLFKLGVLSAARSSRFYWTLIGGATIGVPAILYGIRENFAAGWSVRYSFFFGSQYNYWASILVSLAWIGAVMLACKHGILRAVTPRLAAVGRTAFSNYILQSLICTTIFYGHGFGLYGRIDRATQALIVIVVWVVQIAASSWWLGRFRFGPLEWAWRSATYGRIQSIRRRSGAG